jgi:hypothetical protein
MGSFLATFLDRAEAGGLVAASQVPVLSALLWRFFDEHERGIFSGGE